MLTGRSIATNEMMASRIRSRAGMLDMSVTRTVSTLITRGAADVEMSDVYGPELRELTSRPYHFYLSMLLDKETIAAVKGVAEAYRISLSDAYRVAIARGLDA